jgi:hypothetical protein
MKFTTLRTDIKNYIRKFQIISNYTKLVVLFAINFLFKKGARRDVSIGEVVNPRGPEYSYRNLELGEL